jgi:hypothetical protein
MSTRDNAPTGRNQQLQNGERMKQKDYSELAEILGDMYYKADHIGKYNVRRHIYQIIDLLESTDKKFDYKKFESKLDLESGVNA